MTASASAPNPVHEPAQWSPARSEPTPAGTAMPAAGLRGAIQAPKTALVHDWLNQDGGAEVVLGVLHELFPDAPIFASIADADRVPASRDWDVRTSWMDRLPRVHAHHQPYLLLYPFAWERTQLDGYDLVISNKSGFCHGVGKGGAVHVCYCLTPTRYVWEPDLYIRHESAPAGTTIALRALVPWLRRWELAAAAKVDRFVAISTVVQERVSRFYGRSSTIVFPPTDIDDLEPATDVGDYYLVLARLVPYKRIDLAVEAFNQLGRKLVIVGDGRDRVRLQKLAGPTVEFRGRLPRGEVTRLVARCRALIWPGVEDFGLAPVEAMAAGRPVVARRAGGVLDTVVEGQTGVFFDDESAGALAAAVGLSEAIEWQTAEIRAHATKFGRDVFERELGREVGDALQGGGIEIR